MCNTKKTEYNAFPDDDDIVDLLEVIQPGKNLPDILAVDGNTCNVDLEKILAPFSQAEEFPDCDNACETEESEENAPFPNPMPSGCKLDPDKAENMQKEHDRGHLLLHVPNNALKSSAMPLDNQSEQCANALPQPPDEAPKKFTPAAAKATRESIFPLRAKKTDSPMRQAGSPFATFDPNPPENLRSAPETNIAPSHESQSAQIENRPSSAEASTLFSSNAVEDKTENFSSQFDEVDINELDALLDDLLTSTPEPEPVLEGDGKEEQHAGKPHSVSVTAEKQQETPAILSEFGVDDFSQALTLLRSDVDSLTLRMREILETPPSRDRLDAEVKQAKNIATLQALADRQGVAFASQTTLLKDLELRLTSLATSNDVSRDEVRQQQETLHEVIQRVTNLSENVSTLEQRFSQFIDNIDKIIAEAAARVIHEELAALMQDDSQT